MQSCQPGALLGFCPRICGRWLWRFRSEPRLSVPLAGRTSSSAPSRGRIPPCAHPAIAPRPPPQPLPNHYCKIFPFPVVFWIFGRWMGKDALVRAEDAGAEAVAGYQTPSHLPKLGCSAPRAPGTRARPARFPATDPPGTGARSRHGWFWAANTLAEVEGHEGSDYPGVRASLAWLRK